MISDMSYLERWRLDLRDGTAGLRLAETDHPLVVLAGASDMGMPRLAIQSTVKPKVPALSNLVLIDRSNAGEDQWLLTLTLQDQRFTEVFLRLADDVISRSRTATSQATAWRVVDDVFGEWQRLLRPRPLGLLGLDELRGLVGELWLVLNVFTESRPIEQALVGWLGPMGSPQDFWFEDSGHHESKAIGPTATSLKISSADQLDELMELIVLTVPNVAEGTTGSTSLVHLVGLVRDALDERAVGHDELDLRLGRYGVDLEEPYYAETWFTVSAMDQFAVDDAFPAIRASTMPEGVHRVTYQIALSAIQQFKTASIPLH